MQSTCDAIIVPLPILTEIFDSTCAHRLDLSDTGLSDTRSLPLWPLPSASSASSSSGAHHISMMRSLDPRGSVNSASVLSDGSALRNMSDAAMALMPDSLYDSAFF